MWPALNVQKVKYFFLTIGFLAFHLAAYSHEEKELATRASTSSGDGHGSIDAAFLTCVHSNKFI